ncbi:unnamed protein product [Amoebophrya sp. A120]|nr:unnamed protein product [Amoebophrya sp. A120]|eukprot:GSA120T00007397001.1
MPSFHGSNSSSQAALDASVMRPQETRKPSTVSYTRKQSLVEKIKKFQTERKSERFYRFLHHDLTFILYYSSTLCALFHVFYCLVRETEPKSGSNLQKFCDAVLRIFFSVWLCVSMIKQPAQLWQAPFYFWMSLHLFSTESSTAFGTLSVLFGVVMLLGCIVLCAREARFYLESPKLYKAFSTHATMVDERGRILFYRKTKQALQDAGASSELTTQELNLLIDGMEFFEKSVEDPSTLTEELYMNWDQFALLYEGYVKMLEAGKFPNHAGKAADKAKAKALDQETIGANAGIESVSTGTGLGNGPIIMQEDGTGSVPDESVLGPAHDARLSHAIGGGQGNIVQIELEDVAIHETDEPDAE